MKVRVLNEICLEVLRFDVGELGEAEAAHHFGIASRTMPAVLDGLADAERLRRIVAAPFALFAPEAAAMREAIGRAPWTGSRSGYRALLRLAHLLFVEALGTGVAGRSCVRLALGDEFAAVQALSVSGRLQLTAAESPWFRMRPGIVTLLTSQAAADGSHGLFMAVVSLAVESVADVGAERA